MSCPEVNPFFDKYSGIQRIPGSIKRYPPSCYNTSQNLTIMIIKQKKISSKLSSGIIHSVPYKNATLSGYSLSTKLHILVGHPVKHWQGILML